MSLGMCRPSSALRMAEGAGGMLRAWSGATAGMRRWDEGDDQRGPQFRDCARMVHKTANVLDKLPKGSQPKAKGMLHEISMAEGRAKAEKAFDLFVAAYEAKYPKATECLSKDREALLTFYDFPAEHWVHIRTTNPIESTFATVRLRHDKTKGNGSRGACLAMVYKLMETASKKWRTLNGSTLLPEVVKGTVFVDGVRKQPAA
jgi:putative transposase